MLVLAKYESALKRCDEVSGAVSALIFLSQSAKAVDRGRAEVDSRQTSNQGRGWVRWEQLREPRGRMGGKLGKQHTYVVSGQVGGLPSLGSS